MFSVTMLMCPQCGRLFERDELVRRELIPEHPEAMGVICGCPGSRQAPRNAESDRRPLWNGKPNPHLQER
jgi:hypothetical protein